MVPSSHSIEHSKLPDTPGLKECSTCGRDLQGSLFACPRCNDGAIGIKMEMNLDEHREYQYAKRQFRAEKGDGFLGLIVRMLRGGL